MDFYTSDSWTLKLISIYFFLLLVLIAFTYFCKTTGACKVTSAICALTIPVSSETGEK